MNLPDHASIAAFDTEEVQGDVVPGFHKDHRRFSFWIIDEPILAKRALGELSHRLATAEDVLRFNAVWKRLAHRRGGRGASPVAATWCNVAFSYSGLRRLGVTGFADNDAWHSFERGVESTAGPMLGRQALPSDVVISIAGDRQDMVDEEAAYVAGLLEGHGLRSAGPDFVGHVRTADDAQVEPFGFRDAVANPTVVGLPRFDIEGNSVPADTNGVPADRFLVGLNGDGSAGPDAHGSYLVLLKIKQDVAAFERFCRTGAARLNADWGEDGPHVTEDDFAALVVGRRRDGTALALRPIGSTEAAGGEPDLTDDFDYGNDSSGRRCPLSAHVRKMNPRLPGDDRHTVLRRGVPFEEGANEGLLFVCYQSSVADGFERLQYRWADSPLSSAERRLDDDVSAQLPQSRVSAASAIPVTDLVDYAELLAAQGIMAQEAPADALVGRPARTGVGNLEIPRPAPLGGSTAIPLPITDRWTEYLDGQYYFVPARSALRAWTDLAEDHKPQG